MELKILIKKLHRKETEYDLALQKKKNLETELKGMESLLTNLEKARVFLVELTRRSQEEILKYISEVTTICVQTIYGTDFRFEIEVKELHNQPEFHFYIKEGDIVHNPKDDSICGGMYDMISLGLKASIFSLDRTLAPILFLDEPAKNLGNKTELGGEVIKKLQEILKIQIAIITHSNDLSEIGDSHIHLGEH